MRDATLILAVLATALLTASCGDAIPLSDVLDPDILAAYLNDTVSDPAARDNAAGTESELDAVSDELADDSTTGSTDAGAPANSDSQSSPVADGQEPDALGTQPDSDGGGDRSPDPSPGSGEGPGPDGSSQTVWSDDGDAGADTTGDHDDGSSSDSVLFRAGWLLRAYGPARGPLTRVDPNEPYALEFSVDQTVTGRAHCNSCRGSFVTGRQSAIRIDLPCSDMACSPPPTVPHYKESIADVFRYELRDGRLHLYFIDRFTGVASVLVYEPQMRPTGG